MCVRLSICLCGCPSVYLFVRISDCLSVCVDVCLSTFLSVFTSVRISVLLSGVYLSGHLSLYLQRPLSVRSFVHLSTIYISSSLSFFMSAYDRLSVNLSVCLSTVCVQIYDYIGEDFCKCRRKSKCFSTKAVFSDTIFSRKNFRTNV